MQLAPDINDTNVISAFLTRTTCKTLVHKHDCDKTRTIHALLNITINYALGKESGPSSRTARARQGQGQASGPGWRAFLKAGKEQEEG